MPKPNCKDILIRDVPAEVHAEAKKLAIDRGVTLRQLIVDLISAAVKNEDLRPL